MAKDRTAIDTIRGYYYQFDLYALRILDVGKPPIQRKVG